MIYIIARWESTQMDNTLELRMWRQLKGAFAPVPADMDFIFTPISGETTATQYETMSEALAALPDNVSRVFLEPSGTKSLAEIPDGDIALILGNTEKGNVEHAQADELYKINTPGTTDMYGHNAAAIALAVRYGQ